MARFRALVEGARAELGDKRARGSCTTPRRQSELVLLPVIEEERADVNALANPALDRRIESVFAAAVARCTSGTKASESITRSGGLSSDDRQMREKRAGSMFDETRTALDALYKATT